MSEVHDQALAAHQSRFEAKQEEIETVKHSKTALTEALRQLEHEKIMDIAEARQKEAKLKQEL